MNQMKLTTTAILEPATLPVFAGLAVLGFGLIRRHRA
jgi:hypothetical protein